MKRFRTPVAIVVASMLPGSAFGHRGPHLEDLGGALRHTFTQQDHLLAIGVSATWLTIIALAAFLLARALQAPNDGSN
ncbi:hypothetical protein [Methylocystis sp. ATCC 49242]|uniref:hypothetical protein n=1 Tax=Methylocystis sp. ATCC 49242 TaxID=622637 RepID=UPI0001F886A7|nr:hypothetical protein [Methylocystis sp. ATCC 49242]